ncbi:MAG TPA: FtsX-like permease family protein [Gammaproteobacteria bacterium]
MRRLLLRASARFYLRHPWQLALAIAGVALGVAVYVGVAVANDSARRAFELSSEVVTGRTTHRVLPVGGGLPEDVYTDLVTRVGIANAAPVVEGAIVIDGRRATLLGIDPLEEPAVRGSAGWLPGRPGDAVRLLTEPRSVLLPERLAEALGAADGDARLEARIGGRSESVRAIGTVRAASADADVPVVTDIATAQVLTGRLGTLDRIDLRLDERDAERVAAALPAGATLVAAERDTAFEQLTRAFEINLTALGLLALVVGMFLIYSTMSFAIVQRRAVFGTLLAIGLARRDLLLGVWLEALLLGVVATGLGLVLGHVLAQGLVDLVLLTIGDFTFSSRVAAAEPSVLAYVVGAVVGVGATLVSALGPAVDAARGAPAAAMRRAALERRTRRRARLAAGATVPALGAAALLLSVESDSLVLGFGALFLVLVAGALATPAVTALSMRVLEPPVERGFGIPGLLAVRGVTASLSRTGVATAALAVAVATVIGIGMMIESFRGSLVEWLETTLTADLYVSLDRASSADDGLVAAIEAVPGVIGTSLNESTRIPTALGDLGLRASRPGPEGWGLDVVEAGPDALERLASEPVVAVAEPFAFRHGLAPGDRLVLPARDGEREFPIVAVYRDYDAGGNAIMMSLDVYRRLWDDPGLSSIGVHVADRGLIPDVEASLRELLPRGAARIVSTEGVIELSLDVFDRTFRITEVLRMLAATIAFLGVLSALLSIELEKAREHAVLRAVGLAPRGLATLTLTQTGLLGIAAALAAIPIGIALAALLVHVINRRSFGWTMSLDPAVEPVLAGAALAIGAALLAGIYPALRMRRAELGRALREE